MPFEVEQKFRVGDRAALERKLAEHGAVPGPPIAQVDRYYAHPARDFAQTDEALRIRQVGELNYVAYKGPKLDPTTKTRREIELPLPAGSASSQAFAELLAALSFRPVAEVRKVRRTAMLACQGEIVEIALDEVDGLGVYVELEIVAEESQLDTARARLAALAAALELTENERRSYLELLLGGRPE